MFLFINKTYIYWSCTLLYICSSLKDICTLPQSFIFLFFQTDDEPKSGISLLLHIPTPGRQRKWPVLFFLWRKNSIYQGLFLHNINKACMPWGFVTVRLYTKFGERQREQQNTFHGGSKDEHKTSLCFMVTNNTIRIRRPQWETSTGNAYYKYMPWEL